MPSVTKYPLPRKKYEARGLEQIRGRACKQLKARDKKQGRGSNNVRKGYDRRRKLKARIEKEIDKKAEELKAVDEELAKREQIKDLASKAPSVKEMRGAVASLFKEMDLDPIKEMIKMVKRRGAGALPPHQKAMLLKELAQYQAPKPKSVDVQADMDMHVTVGMNDFRNTSKAVVDVSHHELTDEDYDEFEGDEN